MPYFALLWQRVRVPFSVLVFSFVGSAVGYKILFPAASWHSVFFMTAITLSTVGYGDVLGVENDPIASVYTMAVIIVGMGGVLYAISSVTAFIVEGHLKNIIEERRVSRQMERLNQHYIICGSGQTGIHVVRELHSMQKSFVVIETNNDMLERVKEDFPEALTIHGDATGDQVLEKAGVERAAGLVAALSSDKDNLFLVISSRMLNPSLKIVSRAIDMNIIPKLQKAGANYVVSPNYIGGMRIASQLVRPHVVSFLDRMLRGKDSDIRVEEVVVPENSPLIGSSLDESEIHRKSGVYILAYSPDGSSENFIYNPSSHEKIIAGAILVFIGHTEQKQRLMKLFSPAFL